MVTLEERNLVPKRKTHLSLEGDVNYDFVFFV